MSCSLRKAEQTMGDSQSQARTQEIFLSPSDEPALVFCWELWYSDSLWEVWVGINTHLWWPTSCPVVKNLPANAGDARDEDMIPRPGRSPGIGSGNPLQYSCLGNPVHRGSWQSIVLGVAGSQTRLRMQAGGLSHSLSLYLESAKCFLLIVTASFKIMCFNNNFNIQSYPETSSANLS